MPLVEYDDSDSEDSNGNTKLQKENSKPIAKAPTQFRPRLRDPAFHHGPRMIDHIKGQWPAHVYLEYLAPADVRCILNSKASSLNFTSLASSELDAPLPLHVSLSDTLSIADGDRARFLNTVQVWSQSIRLPQQTLSGQLETLDNPTKTKTFLAALFSGGHLQDLIESLNRALERLGTHVPLFSSEKPHISIGWTQYTEQGLDHASLGQLKTPISVDFFCIHVKLGTEIHKYNINT